MASLTQELMSLDEELQLPANIDELLGVRNLELDLSSYHDSDSLGSACSSPVQSSPESLSPVSSPGGAEGFVFPEDEACFKKKSKRPKKVISNEERLKRKGESKVKRNERERRRVRRLAEGFRLLRKVVPSCGGEENKKLSKLDTLRHALDYMQDLAILIQEDDMCRMQSSCSYQVSPQQHQCPSPPMPIKLELPYAASPMSNLTPSPSTSPLRHWTYVPQQSQLQSYAYIPGLPMTLPGYPMWLQG